MTLEEVHSKLLLFESQAKEEGLSEVQASRLFGWWLNCPRDKKIATMIWTHKSDMSENLAGKAEGHSNTP